MKYLSEQIYRSLFTKCYKVLPLQDLISRVFEIIYLCLNVGILGFPLLGLKSLELLFKITYKIYILRDSLTYRPFFQIKASTSQNILYQKLTYLDNLNLRILHIGKKIYRNFILNVPLIFSF